MMKETNIQTQVTSTIAGDDGEAMGKSEENARINEFFDMAKSLATFCCSGI